ncbi:metal ABC transporter substrate-binding protein [Nocardioides sp.]|uniref:metal ABC transporter substrate-binding protein n=1 Tax=Nocardioides sp. TaxID=35761 RepID=UPI0027186DD1|nr:metal ABC transporter substrate-binding protein [Nocardioides sp.]MDO9458136.1 metal ABC transporter substrate-binding protein [Nocardioides sp.]
MRRAPLLLTLLLATSGCAAFGDDTEGTQVAAAFYPLEYVAERVAGDLAVVSNLTTPGTEPHDLELTIRETAEIARADLVIHEDGLQPAVDDAVAQNAAGEVIDAAAVIGLQPFADEHGDDHTEGDGHDHGDELDPHFWLDPLKMADLGDAVAESLSDIDPDHADDFAAGAAALRADLVDLDAAFTDGLADCDRHTIVVSHDAFGYLGRYGLEVAPVAGLTPDAEPTPAVLADLQDLIRDDGITTVFSERLASPRLTQALADDMGVRTAVLDPLEGLADTTSGDDYLSLMRGNLAALREANGCR